MTAALLRRWTLPIGFLVASALFFFANRAAYKGYFSDDDLTNLGWPTLVGNDVFVHGFLTPKFTSSNFRPTGFLYYRLMGRTFKLHYHVYVAALQIIHALNVAILFFLLRRLNLSNLASAAGALFYAFDAAVIEAYWKPMYVFDLLCGTLCLLTLLLYIRGHWILALPVFWLAYKSKEMAVMLPVALVAYEWLLAPTLLWPGKPLPNGRGSETRSNRRRRWMRLIPFFAISLNFGLQALWHNLHMTSKDVYALNFTPHLLWNTIAFYSSSILILPFAGLAVFALPIFVRDRRLYFGLIAMVSLLVPLVLLSNRVANAYWYTPLIGLAIVVAVVASRVPRWAVAIFFVLWLPLNYAMLIPTRREILAHVDDSRAYVDGLRNYAKRIPPVKAVVFDATPPYMKPWGVDGAITLAFGIKTKKVWWHDHDLAQAMANVPMAVVSYDPMRHTVKGLLRVRNELESAINFNDKVPDWQFGDGWYRYDGGPMRWASVKAEVTLHRPAGSREFEIACLMPLQGYDEPSKVSLIEDGRSLGVQVLSDLKGQTLRWKLPDADAGDKHITILSDPVRYAPEDLREWGIAVRSLGYVAP